MVAWRDNSRSSFLIHFVWKRSLLKTFNVVDWIKIAINSWNLLLPGQGWLTPLVGQNHWFSRLVSLEIWMIGAIIIRVKSISIEASFLVLLQLCIKHTFISWHLLITFILWIFWFRVEPELIQTFFYVFQSLFIDFRLGSWLCFRSNLSSLSRFINTIVIKIHFDLLSRLTPILFWWLRILIILRVHLNSFLTLFRGRYIAPVLLCLISKFI